MGNRRDGGPAFPIVCDGDPVHMLHSEGMTLRDYFAGQAIMNVKPWSDHSDSDIEFICKEAFRFSDAMLKERAK